MQENKISAAKKMLPFLRLAWLHIHKFFLNSDDQVSKRIYREHIYVYEETGTWSSGVFVRTDNIVATGTHIHTPIAETNFPVLYSCYWVKMVCILCRLGQSLRGSWQKLAVQTLLPGRLVFAVPSTRAQSSERSQKDHSWIYQSHIKCTFWCQSQSKVTTYLLYPFSLTVQTFTTCGT